MLKILTCFLLGWKIIFVLLAFLGIGYYGSGYKMYFNVELFPA